MILSLLDLDSNNLGDLDSKNSLKEVERKLLMVPYVRDSKRPYTSSLDLSCNLYLYFVVEVVV